MLAEVWFGQGEKFRDLVVVTVSAGVGTGIFSNGRLVKGRKGMVGEFGPVALDPNGPECTCGGGGVLWRSGRSKR